MAKAPKIVISHRLHEDGMKVLEDAGAEVVIVGSGEPADMLPYLKDADGVIIRIGSIDKATMEQCPNLKAIGRPGVGVDSVDVKGATELGIPVVIAPGANTRSVAEHAMAMIFACAKNMLVCDHEMRKGNFGIRSDPFRGTSAMHAGVDIPGPTGTPVYATADGIVDHASRLGGYGNMVEINHGKGIATRYGHLSKILVADNTRVKRGQLIADLCGGRRRGGRVQRLMRAHAVAGRQPAQGDGQAARAVIPG